MSISTKNVDEKADDGDVTSSSPKTGDIATKDEEVSDEQIQPPPWRRVYDTVFWVPPNCRWDPDEPPAFSMPLNILFAFAGAFTVANLYYNHPILNILARDFHVPYEKVAQIHTVAQAGYACGLIFLCPLGDLLKRRPFVLSLVFFTATMTFVTSCYCIKKE